MYYIATLIFSVTCIWANPSYGRPLVPFRPDKGGSTVGHPLVPFRPHKEGSTVHHECLICESSGEPKIMIPSQEPTPIKSH